MAVEAVEPGDRLEKEAAGGDVEFEFCGELWTLDPDFFALDFFEQTEQGHNIAALRLALGIKQYMEARRIIRSPEDINEALNAVAEAIGGGSMGESRASRRASARKPRR